jgi:hypothetical protein
MVYFLASGCLEAAFFSTLSFSLSYAFHLSNSSSESLSCLSVGCLLRVDCFLKVGFLWGPSKESDLGEFTVSFCSYPVFDSRLLEGYFSSKFGLNKRPKLLFNNCFISFTALSFGFTIDLLLGTGASFFLLELFRFRFRGWPPWCDPGSTVFLRVYWSKFWLIFFFFFFFGLRDLFSFFIWSLIAWSLKLSLASARS